MYILVIIYDCIYILVKYTAFLKIGMHEGYKKDVVLQQIQKVDQLD